MSAWLRGGLSSDRCSGGCGNLVLALPGPYLLIGHGDAGVGIITRPGIGKCAADLRHALQTVGVGGRSVVTSA